MRQIYQAGLSRKNLSKRLLIIIALVFPSGFVMLFAGGYLFSAIRALCGLVGITGFPNGSAHIAVLRLRGAAPHFFAERNGGKNRQRGRSPFGNPLTGGTGDAAFSAVRRF
jgi:hypothetical protein